MAADAVAEPADLHIRAQCLAGDPNGATAAALTRYGAEIFGFLLAQQKDPVAAEDAFSLFSEALWRTLQSFRWQCSLRTWAYRLARNAAADLSREVGRRGRREAHLSSAAFAQIAERVRTETLSQYKTEKRSALMELRDELAPDDRALLILRADRNLAWKDLARVLSDPAPADEAALDREAARLRKRFQIVKDRLRARAQERGLL